MAPSLGSKPTVESGSPEKAVIPRGVIDGSGVFASANALLAEENSDESAGKSSCGVETQSTCEEKEMVVKRKKNEKREMLNMIMQC